MKAEYRGFKLGITGADEASPLVDVLKRGKDGILLTLDEAHEAPPEMVGLLLKAAQITGESRPVAVVLAGTPGLEATLHATHASFWSRGRTLPIGLLGETSAIEALARPFQNAGIEADGRAIEELARAADNDPYFLQLYGEAAWNVVEASGGRSFLPEHVAPADRRLTDAALDALLAYEGGCDHKEFLIAKGYVWQDGSGVPSWTPGIPSLMDDMLETIPAP